MVLTGGQAQLIHPLCEQPMTLDERLIFNVALAHLPAQSDQNQLNPVPGRPARCERMKKLLLIDGNNLLFRSCFATAAMGNLMKNSQASASTNATFAALPRRSSSLLKMDYTHCSSPGIRRTDPSPSRVRRIQGHLSRVPAN
ncbi:MAG: hypothetical protein MZW92_59530 [Comamonadaceae bacterium]|nr:hypothetical protein [Comamonadaceae bacterium]